MHRPSAHAQQYQPPTRSGARLKLLIGLAFGGVGALAAYAAHDVFSAWERGETNTAPVPSLLIDLYDAVGKTGTVGALLVFCLAVMLAGIVGWQRDRKVLRELGR